MHTTELKVRFSELDPYGHVNHAVYLNYLEIGRIDALDAVGLSLGWLRDEGFHVPVVEVLVGFRRPAQQDDRLTVESAITEVRAASVRWAQRILCAETAMVTAEVRTAVTDLHGRPRRGPPGWEQGLGALCQ